MSEDPKKYLWYVARDGDDLVVGDDPDEAFDEFLQKFKKVPLLILGQPTGETWDDMQQIVLWDAHDEMGEVQ